MRFSVAILLSCFSEYLVMYLLFLSMCFLIFSVIFVCLLVFVIVSSCSI